MKLGMWIDVHYLYIVLKFGSNATCVSHDSVRVEKTAILRMYLVGYWLRNQAKYGLGIYGNIFVASAGLFLHLCPHFRLSCLQSWQKWQCDILQVMTVGPIHDQVFDLHAVLMCVN